MQSPPSPTINHDPPSMPSHHQPHAAVQEDQCWWSPSPHRLSYPLLSFLDSNFSFLDSNFFRPPSTSVMDGELEEDDDGNVWWRRWQQCWRRLRGLRWKSAEEILLWRRWLGLLPSPLQRRSDATGTQLVWFVAWWFSSLSFILLR